MLSRRQRHEILKRNQDVALAEAEVLDSRGLEELRAIVAKAERMAFDAVSKLPKDKAPVVRDRVVGPLRDVLRVLQQLTR